MPQKMDPDAILNQAKREMEDIHLQNRERAVQAFTQRNNLQQMVYDLEHKIESLAEEVRAAEEDKDGVRSEQIRRIHQAYQVSLATTTESLQKATATADVIKAHILREQEEVRKRTAELLALQAEWRAGVITEDMEQRLRAHLHHIHEENDTVHSLRAARDVVAVLLASIAALLLIVLFLVLR